MKTLILVLTIVPLLLIAAGCKPSNRTAFKPSLISIDPGEGWKRLDIPAQPPARSPRLIGKSGMINSLLMEDETDLQKAADFLQESFAKTSLVVPGSFKQEPFTTETGLAGIHISYLAKSDEKETEPDLRSHSFVTHNRRNQCVTISYITSPKAESPAVIEAIRKTLRVE